MLFWDATSCGRTQRRDAEKRTWQSLVCCLEQKKPFHLSQVSSMKCSSAAGLWVITWGHGRGTVSGGWRCNPSHCPRYWPSSSYSGGNFNSFWGETEREMKQLVHSHVKKLCMMELGTEPAHVSPRPCGWLLSCDSVMKLTVQDHLL